MILFVSDGEPKEGFEEVDFMQFVGALFLRKRPLHGRREKPFLWDIDTDKCPGSGRWDIDTDTFLSWLS